MKKILIAIDCTPLASELISAAKALTKNIPEAEIVLFHSLLQPDYYFSGQYGPILGFNEYYNSDLTRLVEGGELRNSVLQFIENLRMELDIPNAEIQIVAGDPGKVINEAVHNQGIDLLIIGKQNKNNSGKSQIGHITSTILQQASIPVMVIS